MSNPKIQTILWSWQWPSFHEFYMVFLVAVVWEEGQPVSWKYSLLHTILTSQLGEVRSLQHIASACDAFQLYHLEPPLETIHWLTTLAIMIFSTVASTHRWFWYSQMTASKSNGHFLSQELQGQVDSRNQIRARFEWSKMSQLLRGKHVIISIRGNSRCLSDPLCFLLGYIFQPGKW